MQPNIQIILLFVCLLFNLAACQQQQLPQQKSDNNITNAVVAPIKQLAAPTKLVAEKTCPSFTSEPSFNVTNFSVQDCIYTIFGAAIKTQHGYYPLNNPNVTAEDSQCGQNVSTLAIRYGDCANLTIVVGSSGNKTYVKSLSGKFIAHNSTTNSNQTVSFNTTTELFATPKGHYYKCDSAQSIPIGTPNETNATLLFAKFSFEAARNSIKQEFVGVPEVCPLDTAANAGSDWLTLAVGICLVALLVIVLVAYFVGRNRWYARSSYESV